MEVGLHHDREQGLVDPAAPLQQRREERLALVFGVVRARQLVADILEFQGRDGDALAFDAAKDLAYCLYDIAANKRREASEATAYNALIADWTELSRMAASVSLEDANRQLRFEV